MGDITDDNLQTPPKINEDFDKELESFKIKGGVKAV